MGWRATYNAHVARSAAACGAMRGAPYRRSIAPLVRAQAAKNSLLSTLLAPARGAEVAPLLASRGCSCIEMTSQPVIARTTFEAGVGWAYLTQSGEIWVRRPAHSQRQS
jgi:hypothetical protein